MLFLTSSPSSVAWSCLVNCKPHWAASHRFLCPSLMQPNWKWLFQANCKAIPSCLQQLSWTEDKGTAAPDTARNKRSSLDPESTPASSLLWEKGPFICLGWEKCDLSLNEPALYTHWFICYLAIPGGNTKDNLPINTHEFPAPYSSTAP